MGRSVLVVGSGGREHALCLALSISESIDTIHTTPGNAGTHHFGTNHNVSASDIDGLVELAKRLAVDYVVVTFLKHRYVMDSQTDFEFQYSMLWTPTNSR